MAKKVNIPPATTTTKSSSKSSEIERLESIIQAANNNANYFNNRLLQVEAALLPIKGASTTSTFLSPRKTAEALSAAFSILDAWRTDLNKVIEAQSASNQVSSNAVEGK